MTEELESRLVADFPEMFAAVRKTKRRISFGIECGDGWYTLIRALCYQARASWINDGLITRVTQIKEKFGGLRFYYTQENDPKMVARDPASGKLVRTHYRIPKTLRRRRYIGRVECSDGRTEYYAGAVQLGEALSYHTCEECGLPGELGGRGWYRTLCTKCRSKLEKGKGGR